MATARARLQPHSSGTADDNFIGARHATGDGAGWASRSIEGADPASIDDALGQISAHSDIWHTDKRSEYDPSTDEYVLYLDGRTSSAHQNG